MGPTIYFFVNDTSPSILYSPLGDTFSTVNLTAGWNPYFSETGFIKASGDIGQGTSSHTTSLNDAALSITWRGTGIQLSGYTTAKAAYEVTLDDVPQRAFGANRDRGVLATFSDLADSIHNVSLNARIPSEENPGTSRVYFDNAAILVNSPSNNSFRSLDDRNISFLGRWTIQNSTNDFNQSYHHSINQGDVARATFSGAAFLLSGMTSPKAGRYSVILDNVTSTLFGRSSFTNPETLLFFATGLDPARPHDVQITNEDGSELSLKVGGFEAFAAGSPTAPMSLSMPSPPISDSHPKGTIAALVLAGILGFLVMSGALFFFFVIRPRRRRVRRLRMERRRRKEQEAVGLGVLNIAPPVSLDGLDLGSTEASPGHQAHRSSGKSGFARWKREMEGGLGGIGLGITFRHSGSTAKRPARPEDGGSSGSEPLSTKSSLFTMSSRLSSKRGAGKDKRKAMPKHVTEGPSFALELAVRPESSADSFKEKDESPTHPGFPLEERLSITSGLTSLSYMNTPPPPPVKLAPQSHSVASSERNFNKPPRTAPHSVSSPSSNGRSLQGSAGLLLNYGDPNAGTPEEDPNHHNEPFISSDPAHLLSPLAPRDRGSAQYSSDDATSYLGPAAARLAIRGLSPRTSEYAEPPLLRDQRGQQGTLETRLPESAQHPTVGASSAEQGVRMHTPIGSEISFLDVVSPMKHPIELQAKDDGSIQLSGRAVPDVPSTSSFVIDLAGDALRKDGGVRHTGSAAERKSEERGSEKRQSPRNRLSVIHVTTPSNAPSAPQQGHARSHSASFLDFSSSSDASYHAQSVAPSDLSNQDRERQLQSRWSSTVSQLTDITRSGSSGVSIPVNSPASGPTLYFPYPVSLPPSPHHPEGHISSPPSQAVFQRMDPLRPNRYPARALRLSAFGSPTDSVPMSVTERKIRHSDSTGDSQSASNSSQLPPHPPLPDLSPAKSPVP